MALGKYIVINLEWYVFKTVVDTSFGDKSTLWTGKIATGCSRKSDIVKFVNKIRILPLPTMKHVLLCLNS